MLISTNAMSYIGYPPLWDANFSQNYLELCPNYTPIRSERIQSKDIISLKRIGAKFGQNYIQGDRGSRK